jgi:hypothetical protein
VDHHRIIDIRPLSTVTRMVHAAHVTIALLCLISTVAVAQPSATLTCDAHQVIVSAPLSKRWADSLARACVEIAQRRDLDASARVTIAPAAESGLTLQAILRDGRSAVRYVDTAEALSRTLQALLALPRTAVAAAPPAPPAPKIVPRVSPERRDDDRTSTPVDHALLHIGFGVSIIGHLFGAPTYAAGGFAARVSLRTGRLLLDVTPRWEAAQASRSTGLPDFEMHLEGLGVQLAARVWSDADGAVETGIGMLLVEETQSYREMGKELDASRLSGQASALARLLWGRPELRWSVGLELSLAPSRLAHAAHLRDTFPELPIFGVGVGFGAHWESE